MRIKNSILIILISGVGTALAMAVPSPGPEDLNVPDVIGVGGGMLPEKKRINSEPVNQLQSEVHFDLSAIKRTIPDNLQTSRLFQSKSWYKAPLPPPVQSVPLPPVAPSAPPLPFSFIGRMIDGNNVTLFLLKNGQHYTVMVKDIIESVYQVDAISDNDADLTYLPMKISQKLIFDSNLMGRSSLDTLSTLPRNGVSIIPSNMARPIAVPATVSVSNR